MDNNTAVTQPIVKTPGRPAVRRTPFYLGPGKEIRPEELGKYEATGNWCIQPKIDGMFCSLVVGGDEGGKHLMKSRDARTPKIDGGDLATLPLPYMPKGTVLLGELEACSQAATLQVEKSGIRRMHLFDILQWGDRDLRDLGFYARWKELSGLLLLGHSEEYLPIVWAHEAGFQQVYDRIVAEDGEGVVLKKRDASARVTRLDGKTENQLKVKRWMTEDYVLTGLTMTPGGKFAPPQRTGQWGLYRNGALVTLMLSGAPAEVLQPENVGKLVAEFKGAVKFTSGALRHGGFLRVRADKSPEACQL